MIVDCAVYADGRRSSESVTADAAIAAARAKNGFVWIGRTQLGHRGRSRAGSQLAEGHDRGFAHRRLGIG